MYKCAPLLKIHLSDFSEKFNTYEFEDYKEQVIDLLLSLYGQCGDDDDRERNAMTGLVYFLMFCGT